MRPTRSTIYSLALSGLVIQISVLILSTLGFFPFGFGMIGGFPGMMSGYGGGMMSGYYYGTGYNPVWLSIAWFIFGFAIIGLGVYGLRLARSGSQQSVHSGSVLLLITAIISFPTMWGFFIGSALLFAAAVIGLSWQQQQQSVPEIPKSAARA